MRIMNLRRTHLVLPAALVISALVLTGCQPTSHPAADTGAATVASGEAATQVASPATQGAPPATAAAAAAPRFAGAAAASGLKSVHSPGIVAIDEQLSAGQCTARTVDAASGEYLPDPTCTPGSADPAVTEDNIASTICTPGYTATVRPPVSDTDKVKAESLREYGQAAAKTTEYDHLVSLELGGSNSVSNLWPEPNRAGATGTTNPKDGVEDTLHNAVCSHRVVLAAAQNAIARNWVTAVKDLGL